VKPSIPRSSFAPACASAQADFNPHGEEREARLRTMLASPEEP
jgi:hypothetical protein